RRKEAPSLAAALERYRKLAFVKLPGLLEGGDVLRVGKRIFVGLTRRTNAVGVRQLAVIVSQFGYDLTAVPVEGCLHLKSAVTCLGRNTLLGNRAWFQWSRMDGFEWVDVDAAEPHAGNALAIGDTVVFPVSFPRTKERIESRGFHVTTIEIGELQKAESGLTCSSLLFDAPQNLREKWKANVLLGTPALCIVIFWLEFSTGMVLFPRCRLTSRIECPPGPSGRSFRLRSSLRLCPLPPLRATGETASHQKVSNPPPEAKLVVGFLVSALPKNRFRGTQLRSICHVPGTAGSISRSRRPFSLTQSKRTLPAGGNRHAGNPLPRARHRLQVRWLFFARGRSYVACRRAGSRSGRCLAGDCGCLRDERSYGYTAGNRRKTRAARVYESA